MELQRTTLHEDIYFLLLLNRYSGELLIFIP